MKYIYELTWTNKIKKHEILEHVEIGGVDVIKTELLGVILFRKSIIKQGDSYLFKGALSLKKFNTPLDKNIDDLKLEINLLEAKLNNLKKTLINAEKRKSEIEEFINNEIELIKKQYKNNKLITNVI